MENITLTGEVDQEDRSIIRLHHPTFSRRLMRKFVGKILEISLKPAKKLRSASQNRYLWGVCYPCIRAYLQETQGETYTAADLHLYNLQVIQGFKSESKEILGVPITIHMMPTFREGKRDLWVMDNIVDDSLITWRPASTSDMSTVEFSYMLEKLRAYWVERGMDPIPDPRPNYYLLDYIKLQSNEH